MFESREGGARIHVECVPRPLHRWHTMATRGRAQLGQAHNDTCAHRHSESDGRLGGRGVPWLSFSSRLVPSGSSPLATASWSSFGACGVADGERLCEVAGTWARDRGGRDREISWRARLREGARVAAVCVSVSVRLERARGEQNHGGWNDLYCAYIKGNQGANTPERVLSTHLKPLKLV